LIEDSRRFSLSQRERAGVRENGYASHNSTPFYQTIPAVGITNSDYQAAASKLREIRKMGAERWERSRVGIFPTPSF
jgi:hypothetical protein